MTGVGRMLLWGVVGAAVGALVGGRAGAGPGVAIGAAAAALTRPRGPAPGPLGDNFLTTAWNYWFPSASAAEKPAGVQRPASGFYAEGGYIYRYNDADRSIVIVSSPRGSGQVTVARGTDAHRAIYRQIVTGVAKPVDAPAVKAARTTKARASSSSHAPAAAADAPASYGPDPAASSASPAPWYQPEGAPAWLIPAGLGVGVLLLLGAAAVALRR